MKKAVTLVSPGGAEAYPSFSPDGKRLVYSVRLAKDQAFHLFVRNLPMSERRQLTGAAGSDIAPVWPPDGASVAFLRMEDGRAECMVVPAAGGAPRTLTKPPQGTQGDSTPAVSADGKTVVFVRNSSEEDADIFTCDLRRTSAVVFFRGSIA